MEALPRAYQGQELKRYRGGTIQDELNMVQPQARGLAMGRKMLGSSGRMAAIAAETESEEAAVEGLANLGSPHSTENDREQDTGRDQHAGAGDASGATGGTGGTGGSGEGARSGGGGGGGGEFGRGGGGAPGSVQDRKRRRVAEQHNKSEQRRRRKINTKLDELQAMVPFSRSREKAAILLDVIEYIKSVQAQLHIMSAITACDYAAYRPSPPRTPHDPYFSAGLGYPSLAGISPTAIMPPMTFHGFPMNSSEALPLAGMYPGGGQGSVGLQPGSSGSGGGGEGEGTRGRGETGAAVGEGGGGWSFSSGESNAALGAAGDNTANSYEPVMY